MGNTSGPNANGYYLLADWAGSRQGLLQDVANQGLLAACLQSSGSSQLAGQSCDHHSGFDIWH